MTAPTIDTNGLGQREPSRAARNRHDWYRIKYAVAATYANLSALLDPLYTEPSSDQGSGTEAYKHALALARACGTTIDELAPRPVGSRGYLAARVSPKRSERKLLRTFLDEAIEPAALTIVVAYSSFPRPDKLPDAPSRSELRRLVESPDPEPGPLLSFVVNRRHAARVDYNLACLYTGWQQWQQAVDSLRAALDGTPREELVRITGRALEDPSLASLWTSGPGHKLHEQLGTLQEAGRARVQFTA